MAHTDCYANYKQYKSNQAIYDCNTFDKTTYSKLFLHNATSNLLKNNVGQKPEGCIFMQIVR